jgi:hypothetical protein
MISGMTASAAGATDNLQSTTTQNDGLECDFVLVASSST